MKTTKTVLFIVFHSVILRLSDRRIKEIQVSIIEGVHHLHGIDKENNTVIIKKLTHTNRAENFFVRFFSSEKSDNAINFLINIIAMFLIVMFLIIIFK